MANARRILAATDFSPAGDAAVADAFAAVAGPGAELILVHAMEPRALPNPLYAHYSPGPAPSEEEEEAARDEARRFLEALVPADAKSRGVSTRVEVRTGHPVDVILELAAELNADLVVVADSGRSQLSRTLLGSVANHVMLHAPCSVLVSRRHRR